MNSRKLFALLMAAVMLLGAVPAGYAEVVDCNHDWAWRWPNGEPVNCQDWKWSESYCTKCGIGDGGFEQCGPCSWRETIVEEPWCDVGGMKAMICSLCGEWQGNGTPLNPLDHDWGSWNWAHGSAPTCTEGAWQVRSCNRCGQPEDKWVEAGEHKWGGYVTETPAGCETPGEEVSYCSVCGEKGSSREIPAKGHDWGDWKWEVKATCNKEGLRVRYCKRCNMREEESVSGGDHQWGKWKTDQATTCTEGGSDKKTCSVCGQSQTRKTDPLGHSFGDWKDDTKPTCTEPGLQCKTCSRCGENQWQYKGKLNHVFGEWYVVKEPEVGVPGLEQHDCTFGCGTYEQREIPALEPENTAGLELALVLSSTPANGTHFVVGEKVTFTETWANGTGKTLYPFSVSIWTCDTPVFGSAVDQICSWFAEDGGGPVAPGASGSHTLTVTVTEDVVARGAIYAMAELLSTVQDGADLENITTPFVTAPCGEGSLSADGLDLTLVLSSTPANGTHFVVGEKVTFTETWANGTGKTLYPFSVSIWTCDTPVFGSAVDQICSWFAEDGGGPVAPGASGSHTLTVTVTEDDVARGAIYAMAELLSTVQDGADLENITTPFVTAPCGEGSLSADGLDLTLVLSSTPANGTHFVVGEKVTFTETWANGTGKTLYPFSVSIWTCDTPVFGSAVDQICSWFAEDGGGPVAPGASGSHTLTVTVTEDDVARGAIYAMAELLSTVQDGADLENVTMPFVTAPCGSDNSGDFGLSDGLSVTKKVTSTPANGSFYVPGETVTYEVCVKNNGEPLNMLCVSDWMRDGTFKYGTIETGEDVTYPISYTVIELDAISGSVSNISFAEAVAANGDPVLEYSNSVTVPCGFPEGDDPFGIFRSLAVVKAEESMPLNGEYYTEGEVIHYTITYTNDGELPLTDVQVWDVMNVTAPIASAEMLNPGESRVCYYQHTVTAEDVAAGFVMNIAHASYPVSSYAGFENSTSNTVYSKTSADDNVWIELPIFPAPGEDPVYDPGTGWLPPDEGEEMPGFGTIDTDTLHSGDSYCVRTITGRDNVSATYETAFCTEHADTQSSALIMMQVAVTPETQMQAAAYAVALWRTEVEMLYQKVFESADATAKTVVMTEYVRFLTDVANYEAMLKALYPDQPALVALKVAEIWENKCVEMCYDAHATAAERKDSLLAVTPTTGAAAAECTCVTTAETNGQRTDVQTYCPAHSFPFGMMDALLQGNDTAEAWTMVRQIWGVELTAAYNKVYAAMGDNKLLAMAEYNALTQWMMAREASLTALYPDHPEIVVQLMVKTIMERVNALCQAVN